MTPARGNRNVFTGKFLLFLIVFFLVASSRATEVGREDYEKGKAAYDKEDYSTAVRHFKLAAEQGSPEAQCELGKCCANGKGVVEDGAEAEKWFRKAAEMDYAEGQYYLALCLRDKYRSSRQQAVVSVLSSGEEEDNTGLESDRSVTGDEIIKWFRKAADQGYPAAQYELGVCYYKGDEFCASDIAAAVKWFLKAAEQSFAPAQSILGEFYANGRGVPQDDAEAVKWFRLAAEQDFAPAQYCLGMYYMKGIVVKKNEREGIRLIMASAKQGCVPAIMYSISYSARAEKRAENARISLVILICLAIFLLIILIKLILRVRKKSPSSGLCPSCRGHVDANAGTCPVCGTAFDVPCDVDPDAVPPRADSRWAARIIDFLLEMHIVGLIAAFGASFFISDPIRLDRIPLYWIVILTPFAFILDSLVYYAFGRTFGKWLFGIAVVRANHTFLSFRECFFRNLRIYIGSFALGIPVVFVIPWIIQRIRILKKMETTYDAAMNLRTVSYKTHPVKTFIGIVFILAIIGYAVVSLGSFLRAKYLPESLTPF